MLHFNVYNAFLTQLFIAIELFAKYDTVLRVLLNFDSYKKALKLRSSTFSHRNT